jgi:hypothetical protein
MMRGNYGSTDTVGEAPAGDRVTFETSAVVLIADLLERSFIETVARYGEDDPARAHAALDAALGLVEEIVGAREAFAETRVDRTVHQIVRATLTVVIDSARARIPKG